MASDLIPIFLASQTYVARSGYASAERIVNIYSEPNPSESPSKISLYRTPGTTTWKDLGISAPIYGMIVMGDYLYVVAGLNFYQINTTKIATLKGSIGTIPGRVMMTENGTQITILTLSGNAYYYDINTDSLLPISDTDYKLSNSVTTLDGYTILTQQESNRFFWSTVNNTASYAALDFASAQAESDNLVRVLNYNRQLILLGTRTIEFWSNTGDLTFPFQRLDGALIKIGCAATYGAVADVSGFYWIGSDKMIYRAIGYQPQKISTFGIDHLIAQYPDISDAFCFVYTQEGHRFLVFTFPTANKTLVYDISTDIWHERESLNPSMQNEVNCWLANCNASFAGQQLVGSSRVGKIYELDLYNYSEDGTPLISKIISATQFDNYNRDQVGRLVVWMDTGVGKDGDVQGTNPQIMMRCSIDGGRTWSEELWQPIGQLGLYQTEVWWEQVSWGRSLIVELKVSDPIKVSITGAFLEATRGKS